MYCLPHIFGNAPILVACLCLCLSSQLSFLKCYLSVRLRGACRGPRASARREKFAFSNITVSLPLTYLLHLPHIILILSSLIYGHSLQADDISYIVVYDGTSNLKGYDWQDRSEWYDDDITRIHLPSLPSLVIINNIGHCPVQKIIYHCHCCMVQMFKRLELSSLALIL